MTSDPSSLFSATHTKTGAVSPAEQLQGLFQEVFFALPTATYLFDINGFVIGYNEAAAALFRHRLEVGKEKWFGPLKIYHGNGSELTDIPGELASALAAVGDHTPFRWTLERTDKTRVDVQVLARTLYNRRGESANAVGVLLQMNEQAATAISSPNIDKRFETLAEQAPLMIWMTNDKGRITYINSAWKKITGLQSAEDADDRWISLIHPDDRERVHGAMNDAMTSHKPFLLKYRLLTQNQEFIIVRSTGTPMQGTANDFAGFIGTSEDITIHEDSAEFYEREIMRRTNDLVRKNEELRRSEERYHKMIDEVQDYAIILLDHNGFIQNWNKGAQHIKGYTTEEAVGMNFRNFYTLEDRASKLPEKLIQQAIETGKANHEGWRVRKDGTTFWGSIVITSLHDAHNNIIGFSKVTRDLTERKHAEEEYVKNAEEIKYKNKELEKMNQELASFAYVSSHDLQEPLRKIQTFASRIVETEKSLSEKGKDYFGRMQNAAFRMQTLIEDLLAYSRTNTTEKKFEETDLNKLLDEVKNELKERIEEKNATIEVAALPTVAVIVFQFRQLLTNVLSNALKFSKAGVTPHVVVTYEKVKGEALGMKGLDVTRSFHHFSVRDNGIGFEPEHRQKIFEVFQRLHGRSEYSGTGIGLAICKKIVENHHGIIYADSQLGEGATFHIAIPVGQE